MKKIGLVGVFDKTDLILCLSKILVKTQKKVLFIDATSIQKTQYVIPAIAPTMSYITNYQDIDIAIGFDSMVQFKQYIGIDEESNNFDYDYIFIDADDFYGFEKFELASSDLLYYVTSFDAYSLKKGIEILRDIDVPVKMEKLFFSKQMYKEEEAYFDYLALGVKVEWKDTKLYFPLENGDQAALIENQRLEDIKFRNLSNIFKENVSYLINEIDSSIGLREIKTIIKDL